MQLMFAGDALDKGGPEESVKMENKGDETMFQASCEHGVRLGAVEAIEDLRYKYISLCFKSRWQKSIHACVIPLSSFKWSIECGRFQLRQTFVLRKYGKDVGNVGIDAFILFEGENDGGP